jgi:carboxylesterase type B
VVVSFNYRVGPWGFLSNGNKVTQNNGLRDQRKALEWVQTNIAKFGGDPDHVVIGGNSAGAASVSMHLMAGNGTDRHLFRGALAGSPSYATMYTAQQSQYQYNQLVTRLGCVGTSSLDCLRAKSAEDIQEVNTNIPLLMASEPPLYQWLPTIDGDFMSDYAYRSFARGEFIKVPTIWGDDTNGGTIFVPKSTSTLAESNQFLLNQYPTLSPEQLGEINALYPNPNNSCPAVGCFWRQASNVYQEARYTCPALFMNSVLAPYDKSYAYLWNVEDPEQMRSGLGVPHTVEVRAMFAPGNPKTPASYEAGGINEKAVAVLQAYWTSFIRTLDPNKHKLEGTADWGQWSAQSGERMVFGTGGTTKMESIGDLKKRCEYWEKNGLSMLL